MGDVVGGILIAHAISGCDTDSCLFQKGTCRTLKLLCSRNYKILELRFLGLIQPRMTSFVKVLDISKEFMYRNPRFFHNAERSTVPNICKKSLEASRLIVRSRNLAGFLKATFQLYRRIAGASSNVASVDVARKWCTVITSTWHHFTIQFLFPGLKCSFILYDVARANVFQTD